MKTRAEMTACIAKIEKLADQYGWWDRVTHPYPHVAMTVSEIVKECKEYDQCTRGSQWYLMCLASGLAERVDAWVEWEKEPKVQMRSAAGKIVTVSTDMVDFLKENDWTVVQA